MRSAGYRPLHRRRRVLENFFDQCASATAAQPRSRIFILLIMLQFPRPRRHEATDLLPLTRHCTTDKASEKGLE